MEHFTGLQILEVEIWEGFPFYQVYRAYSSAERKEPAVQAELERRKNLPEEERKLMIWNKILIGQFNALKLAEHYVTLIQNSQETDFFYWAKSYSDLGYDVTLTAIHGKDAVKMVKRYSHKAERSLTCEQIFRHEKAADPEVLQQILQYLYDDIKRQEDTKEYYEPSTY